MSSPTFAASFVAIARGTCTQPGIDLLATGVSAHQLSGSWRGIGQTGCPSMSLHGVTQINPVAAGRSVRPVAKVRAYAAPAAAQLKRQMISWNGKNGTKGSSPWRFPV
ncbi:MAG: hypothetical protein ACRDV3_05195 [Acidothermaceae bacterium]